MFRPLSNESHIPTDKQTLQLLQVFILLVPNWNLLFPKLCPCASLSVPFPHPPGRICDSPSLDDQQPGALRIIKPTSLFHIHLSDRKGAPFTMEMKHKHAEKTVHEANRESLINLLQSNQQLHVDISTAPSTTHSNSTLACKQFSVKLPAQQGKI